MQETILLYSLQLRNRQRLAFAFKDIGVLSCKDDVLCMRFYYECVTGLERKASRIALLHTVSGSGFEAAPVSLGRLWKGEQPSRQWPAWTWQASPTPFPVLTPTDFSISKESFFSPSGSLPYKKPGSVIAQSQCLLGSFSRAGQELWRVPGGGLGRGVWRSGFLLEQETGLLPLGAKRKLPWKPSHSPVSLCRGCGRQLQRSAMEPPPLGGCRLLPTTRSQSECGSSAALDRASGRLASSCSGARVVGARH